MLTVSDLAVGDVLMKTYHGGFVHVAIHALTKNEGASAEFMHAAIYLGKGDVGEASGPGYRIMGLNNRGTPYTHFVFRYRDPALALIAAQVISTWVRMRPGTADHVPGYTAGKTFGKYNLGGAVANAVKNRFSRDMKPAANAGAALWGKGGKAGVDKSFCSQLVVEAFTAAGATFDPPVDPLPVAARRATPAVVHDLLLRDARWQFVGSLRST